MPTPIDPPPARPGRRLGPTGVNGLVWIVVMAVVTTQHLVLRWLRGGAQPSGGELAGKLALLLGWALATPAIVRSVAHRPLSGARARANAARHALNGAAFVALVNLLLRIPRHAGPGLDWVGLWRDWLDGVTFYGPLAMLVYGAIVLLGQWLLVRAPSDARPVEPRPDHLPLRLGSAMHLVPVGEIRHLEADDNYVQVHAGGAVHRVRGRLSDLEARLDPDRFVRIHRSAIVALDRVRAVVPVHPGDWAVELESGIRLRVARGRRARLNRALAARRGAYGPPSGRYSAAR